MKVLSDLRPSKELERIGSAILMLLLSIITVEAGGLGICGAQSR